MRYSVQKVENSQRYSTNPSSSTQLPMRLQRIVILLSAILLWVTPLAAQQTAEYTDADRFFKRGLEFYNKGLYAKAKEEFAKVIEADLPVNQPEAELLKVDAEFHYAKCTVLMEQPDGEKLFRDFVRVHRPDPITDQGLLEVANYYFNERDYDRALTYYNDIPTLGMVREQRSEIRFKMGYANFVKKDFAAAKSNFMEVADFKGGDYYHPTNYYLGLCYFFEGNYTEAGKALAIAEQDDRYKAYTPYYLSQIYFAERRFDDIITYAEPKLNDPGLRDVEEIHQLVGQSYFEKGDYQRALPHLEYYAERSSKLREEELYQLGYAQYKTGNCQKAIQNLKPLATVNSAVGQHAMLYLADCYMKTDQKASALASLGTAKRMNFDPAITEEALFYHGKLAYELNLPKEAVISLQALPLTSRYRVQAQNLIADIVTNLRDYEMATSVLDNIPDKTPEILQAYQIVSLTGGMQLLQDNKIEEAEALFQKSLQYPVDQRSKAIAYYWLADIAHAQGDYNKSLNYVNQFMTLAKTMSNLPDESSIYTGNYLQGYNYFKLENYPTALQFFQECVEGIKRNRRFIRNQNITFQVLGDATLRAGDCHFKRNQYGNAVAYYDEAINARYPSFIYALYQKAIIEGLRGRTTDKILELERITDEFPNSEYADDALLQLGTTYQEIGKLNQATPPLQRLIRDYRTKSDLINQALIRLGLIAYNQGNLNGAINYYKQVFGNNPTPAEASLALSNLEEIYVEDLGQPAEYFAFLETVPGYKMDNYARDSINYRAAVTKFETGDYSRAIQAFTGYIQNFPNGNYLLDAYFQRGESYSVQRQYTEALRDYEQVVDRGQSRYYLKALEKAAIIAYNHELDFEGAFDLYTKLEAASPSDAQRFEAQLGALRSAYRIGNQEAVYELANKVVSNPNTTQDMSANAYYYLGKVAFDRGDYDSALTAFNQVIAKSDNEQTAEARYLTAYIYYLRRDLNQAQALTIQANKESSAYPYWVARSVLLLADVLAEKGDLYNARAALEALLENYNQDEEVVNTARTRLDQINKQIEESSKLNSNPDSGTMEFNNSNQN